MHMKVQSSVQVNDVSFLNLLVVVLVLQFALWTVMGLNALGWQVPFLQQFLGFVYLTFVPGILILSILRFYHLRFAEIVLYTVGLSIAVVISIGFVTNVVFNALNIIKPFSLLAVTSSVSFVVLGLCAIAYFRNRTYLKPLFNTTMSVPLTPTLFLCIIPFITVFSTYLVNAYNVDVGQLFLYLILGVVVLLVAFDKIPPKLYSFAVFVLALSLLFQRTLISSWLTGWDIQLEWSLANAVLKTGVWNPNVANNYASMLSVVVVAPIYSLISSLDLVWILKLVYPIIFALVPVGLYQIFRRQLNEKVAFLSCFFFMSIATFTELTTLARQEVAELFFVLVILLLVSEEMDKKIRSSLLLVFGLSLMVSHYGMMYILVLFLFVMWLALAALPYLRTNVGIHKHRQLIAPSPKSPPRSAVTIVFILLLLITSTVWYAYTSQASVLYGIISIGSLISGSITDLFNPTYSQAVNNVVQSQSLSGIWRQGYVFVSYINAFLMVAGVCLIIFLKDQRYKLQFSFVVLSTIALGFLIASVALPFLGASLNWTRIYQIISIFLAPFLAIGFIKIGNSAGVTISKIKSKPGFGNSTLVNPSRLTKLLAMYLVLFMLFQTSFIFALTEGYHNQIALDNQIDDMQFNRQEIVGATWLANNSGDMYGDVFHSLLIKALGGHGLSLPYPQHTSARGFYVFLGTNNIEHSKAEIEEIIGAIPHFYYTDVTPFVSNRSLIYANGGANVYS
jgi:uncharacterized membrane protein